MSNGVWLCAAGLAGLSVLAGLVSWYGHDGGFLQEKIRRNGSEELLQLQWEFNHTNPHHMTDKLVSFGNPAKLKRTPFKSLEKDAWTFNSLSQSLKHTLIPFKHSTNPIFKYHAKDQPLSAIPEFNSPQGYQSDVAPAYQLLNRVLDNSGSPKMFHYASGGVELLTLSHPFSQTDLDQLTFRPHKGNGQLNFWIGMGGVTAYTHYDTSHNLHAILTGRKRFLIYPPSAYQQLRLYPCLHQLYRQTQVDVLNSSISIPPPMVVDLEPGEVLYLPPYWFHCVMTLIPSISLNVWSDSDSYLVMEEILTSPVPFESSWNQEMLLAGIKHFVDLLIEKLDFRSSFVEECVLPRYNSLLGNVSSSRLQSLRSTVDIYCSFSSMPSPEELHYIAAKAVTTAKLFLSIHPQAVREINLGNYIEHILYTVLREEDLLELPLFLQCL